MSVSSLNTISVPIGLFVILISGSAQAQTVACAAPGPTESASRAASRAALRCHSLLEGNEDVEVLESRELRRALAGLPPREVEGQEPAEDPLSDVRRLLRRASGDRQSTMLNRLGDRVGVDLLITFKQIGEELEVRAFNTERSAFYRGTLMIPALEPPDEDELAEFILPRAAAASSASEGDEEGSGEERPRRRSRWWTWILVGAAATAAVVVGAVVQPDEVEDTGVTLRIVAP